jgi:hypothetical protein
MSGDLRLLATALAATAVMLVAATAAPAQINAGINARANVGTSIGGGHTRANVGTTVRSGRVGVRQHAMVGVRAMVPPGSTTGARSRGLHHPPGWTHGRKIGWLGLHRPPGFSHGRKVAWHHA